MPQALPNAVPRRRHHPRRAPGALQPGALRLAARRLGAVLISAAMLGGGLVAARAGAQEPGVDAAAEAPAAVAPAQQPPADPVAAAADGESRAALAPVRVSRATGPIVVDGRLDETAWEAAAAVGVAFEWFPGDNTAAPVDTDVRVTFDDERLYVGFRARDPRPAAIRAHLADRDDAFQDDAVGFAIDPFNDRRTAYLFRVNPLGVQMDARLSDVDESEDWSWDAIWDADARLTAEGYVVEIAVPLSQLRFPRGAAGDGAAGNGGAGGQTWGFLAQRRYPRDVEHRLASVLRDRELDCLVCQFAPLGGFVVRRPGLDLALQPTVTAGRTDLAATPGGRLVAGDEDVEAGLTVRWNPAAAVTALGTANPDFSQVEADAVQLDVNTRFALFFPERRPFFLEGADAFSTFLPAVFTRTIADPTAGAKLTGKLGRHSFGLLAAEDSINNLLFPGFEGSRRTSLDEDVLAGVARVQRDVGATSSLGLLWAGRDGSGYGNHVAGLDGTLRPSDSKAIRFQLLGSRTDYPDALAAAFGQPAGGFGGHALAVQASHSDREWFWFGRYDEIDDDFRADSGFLPQVGYRFAQAGANRTFWGGEDRWYRRLEVYLGADTTHQLEGEVRDWGADLEATWWGPKQTVVSVNLAPNEESFAGDTYTNFRQGVEASFRPSGDLGLGFAVRWGGTIDFDNRREADFLRIAGEADFHLGRHVEGTIGHEWQDFEVAPGPLFRAHVTEARVVYHLNVRTYLRAIVQHTDLERNPAVYGFPVEEDEDDLFTQLLFSYRLDPQTALLAGYSDDRRALTGSSLEPAGRTFFLKMGYAFLF
jgi:hypothetical protein